MTAGTSDIPPATPATETSRNRPNNSKTPQKTTTKKTTQRDHDTALSVSPCLQRQHYLPQELSVDVDELAVLLL